MWANAVVSGLAPITIHAEYPKTGRKIVGDKPTVNFLPAASSKSDHFPAVLGTVIVYVVNGEERWFCFTATGALVTAVCVVTFIFCPLVIAPIVFPVAVKIGKSPFPHALGCNAGVPLFPSLLCRLHLV
jgi:hypothetical protein